MTRARRRGAAAATLVAAVLVLTGCTAPRPDVTFYGNGDSARTGAALWCEVDTSNVTITCPDNPDGEAAHLSLRPGDGVEVSVDSGVADAGWLVYVQYRTAAGEVQDARSSFFSDGRLATTVTPPTSTDLITRVEVQSAFLPTGTGSGSTVDFSATRTWVLLTDEAPAYVAPAD